MPSIRRRNGKYQVQVRVRGQSTARSFALMSDAREWARLREYELVGRQNLGRQYQPANFAEILHKYAKEVTPQKRSGRNEKIVIEALLREDWVNIPLSYLTVTHLIEFRDQRLQTVKPATIRRQLNIIKHACTVAERDWDYGTPINIIKKLQLPKNRPHLVRRISAFDQQKLFEELAKCKNTFVLPLVKFALLTAMRRGELLALNWEDIDEENKVIYVCQSKTNHSRQVPLTEQVRAVLEEISTQTSAKIFLLTPNAVRLAWVRARNRAELQHIRFHDLRHEATSRFFEMGLTVPEVASITGHKTPTMLLRYAHADIVKVQRKLDVMSNDSAHQQRF